MTMFLSLKIYVCSSRAAIRLVEKAGGRVVGVGIMLDDMEDEIRKSFASYNLHALIKRQLK